MRKKRDIVEEILAKRSRNHKRGLRGSLAHRRQDALEESFLLLQKHGRSSSSGRIELLRYIPVGLVACIEGYYRMVIRDLIDHGDPFRENAKRLEEVKLDLPTLLRMEKGAVSVGEFVSHLLPLSSLGDINRHLSTLMGGDYLAAVRDSSLLTDLPNTLIEVWPTVFGDVEEAFRLRHIAVHELALKEKPTFSRARRLLDGVFFLLMADDTFWAMHMAELQ